MDSFVQQGDVASGAVALADRQQRRDDTFTEGVAADLDHGEKIGAALVQFRDGDDAGQACLLALLPQRDGGRLDLLAGGDNEHCRVGCPQPGAQLPDVLGVTGGVQEVDLHVPGGDGGQGEGGRSLGGVLLTAITLHPGAQEVLEEGGLSRPAGTDEDDITDLLGRTDCYVSTRL